MARRARPRLHCDACGRTTKPGKYRLCSTGCGALLCRARHIPHCTDLHAGQCPNFAPLEAP
jgi:predicted nucleic acid-binding Zn ribbon protein